MTNLEKLEDARVMTNEHLAATQVETHYICAVGAPTTEGCYLTSDGAWSYDAEFWMLKANAQRFLDETIADEKTLKNDLPDSHPAAKLDTTLKQHAPAAEEYKIEPEDRGECFPKEKGKGFSQMGDVFVSGLGRYPVEKVENRLVEQIGLDPKGSAGAKKDPMQFLPLTGLIPVAHVLKGGADKYGEKNWLKSDGVGIMTYKGAILRHLTKIDEGEDIDEESGQHHLAHIAASCIIMLDALAHGKLIDDRPMCAAIDAHMNAPE